LLSDVCNNLGMPGRTAASIRAQVRAQLTTEIKEAARRQLATEGANLSLRAIAREMGMVSSALYRYFAGRDELLTALIIDAYDAIGEAGERADAAADPDDLLGRWLAVAHAWRDWALAAPAEYALIHGSPVPGYAAPQDTVGPASRRFLVVAGIVRDGLATGRLPNPAAPQLPTPPIPGPLAAELRGVAAGLGFETDAELAALPLMATTELFGALNFELFGQLNNTIDERRAWYDHQARLMASLVGLS
jgi:AcrR family transcriptional regulator